MMTKLCSWGVPTFLRHANMAMGQNCPPRKSQMYSLTFRIITQRILGDTDYGSCSPNRDLTSGNQTWLAGKSPNWTELLIGKSPIKWSIFQCNVWLPDGDDLLCCIVSEYYHCIPLVHSYSTIQIYPNLPSWLSMISWFYPLSLRILSYRMFRIRLKGSWNRGNLTSSILGWAFPLKPSVWGVSPMCVSPH